MRLSFAFLFSAAVAADVCGETDTMSALQSSSHTVKSHQQQSCTSVVAGQTAPINGLFTATDGSKVDYMAKRGDVAQSAGRFCVDEPTVALLQRAFSVSELSEFDVLLQKKSENSTVAPGTTTTEGSVAGKNAATTSEAPTTEAPATDVPPTMSATLGRYPGYDGNLNVTGTVSFRAASFSNNGRDVFLMNWNMQGLEPEGCAGTPPAGVANACGIHIHEGMTCEQAGGHHYNADWATEDPWSTVNYTTNATISNAATGDHNYHAVIAAGTNISSIAGRAVVVHESSGARIACGLISAV